jgi:hypothetical protein
MSLRRVKLVNFGYLLPAGSPRVPHRFVLRIGSDLIDLVTLQPNVLEQMVVERAKFVPCPAAKPPVVQGSAQTRPKSGGQRYRVDRRSCPGVGGHKISGRVAASLTAPSR